MTGQASPGERLFSSIITDIHLTNDRVRAEALASAIVRLANSLSEMLNMIAMVPEEQLAGMRVDPYGTIGDALEALGVDRDPDPWTALHRYCGFPDPPTEVRGTVEQEDDA